ncbi:MAG: hypothetical protein WCK89_21655 [bacterium]
MSVTPFQSAILLQLARQRRERGESYVAGGLALNALLSTPRRSRDIDLFHDTETALAATWTADRVLLEANGYEVRTLREAMSFVEAVVAKEGERTIMQWARDSAFRFFPLVEDESMGLTLHPFDLATNKVLAMAGRLEVRDWVDALYCDESLQPLGCLLWAACGKDPGYNPHSLLAAARRLHYSQAEVDTLDFASEQPDAARLGERWHEALDDSGRIIACLPPEHVGKCVITREAHLFRGNAVKLAHVMAAGGILFHEGRIGGAWPRVTG